MFYYAFLGYIEEESKGITIVECFNIIWWGWSYDCNYVMYLEQV